MKADCLITVSMSTLSFSAYAKDAAATESQVLLNGFSEFQQMHQFDKVVKESSCLQKEIPARQPSVQNRISYWSLELDKEDVSDQVLGEH